MWVFLTCVTPQNPLTVLAIVGLALPISSLTRELCANDSSSVSLSRGLSEKRLIEVSYLFFDLLLRLFLFQTSNIYGLSLLQYKQFEARVNYKFYPCYFFPV
jgi:hypothetical protein